MAGASLPTNVDASYPDSLLDPSAQLHQQHHDVLHRFANRFDVDAVPGSGQVLAYDASVGLYRPVNPASGGQTADLTGTPLIVSAANGGTGAYPDRPATTRPVVFRGVTQPPTTGSTSGGPGMILGTDEWRYWSSGDTSTLPDGSVAATKLASSALDSRLRVDGAQALSAAQKTQAKANLGLDVDQVLLALMPAGYTHSISYAAAMAATSRAAITTRTDIRIRIEGGLNTDPLPTWMLDWDYQDAVPA